MPGSLSEELIAEAKNAGMDLSAPVFSGDDSPPSNSQVDAEDIIARFTGQDDKPTAETAEPTVTEPAATPEAPAQPASFLESYKDDPEFQTDLAAVQQKYGNDREALRGLLNATKLVGQKNELATLGKALVDRPDQALQWLAQNHPQVVQQLFQQVQPQKTEEPAKPTNGHATPLLMQILRLVDKDKLDQAPEGLRNELRTQLQDITLQESPTYKKLTEELNALRQQVAQASQPQMDPRDYTNAAIAQMENARIAREFIDKNSEWIYSNANTRQKSPAGILFEASLNKAIAAGAQSDIAIEYAMDQVNKNKSPSTKPAKTPNKDTAANRPSINKATPETAEVPWDESLGVAGNAKKLAAALGLNIKDMELSY